MNSFYTEAELCTLGFCSLGKNVLLSKKCSIYSPSTISIGNNVRIDDYCILSGKISIGSHIHISAYAAIYGAYGVILDDYSGLSPRSTIYSAVDDFSGDYLIGPIHNDKCIHLIKGEVHIGKYSQVGANSIIFPNVNVGEGVAIGAFSMVKANLDPWGIYAGIPVIRLKDRSKGLLKLACDV